MPTSKRRRNRKHRSVKPAAQLPANITAHAHETLPAMPNQPSALPNALPALAETTGNEREIDLSGLSPRQQVALPIVACSPTIAQAARVAGVGESTLRRWLNVPAFRDCLDELRRQSANATRQKFLALTPLCVSVLADAMQNPDPAIRLRAANYALSFNLRSAELETLRSNLDDLASSVSRLRQS